MSKFFRVLAAASLFAAVAAAQGPPTITANGIFNNYSWVAPGLPNYGIAQGSIFTMFGTNFAPTAPLQALPLQTNLNGLQLNVTVNGTTTHPPIYYVTANQLAAILPSATPVGLGTITITTSAGTSSPAPITVVQSAFGILTTNQVGTGMGQIQNASNNYNLLSLTSPAKSGDILVLWGSGLGPVSGDETGLQSQTDFGSGYPIEVDIGGTAASIAYRGRSQYPGLDEIVVTVPPNAAGCSVSVVVWNKSNNLVSNIATAPIGANGTCQDPNNPIPTSVVQKCLTTGCSVGAINIIKTTTTTQPLVVNGIPVVKGGTNTTDDISGSFSKFSAIQAATGLNSPQFVSVGSCTVYTFSFTGLTPPGPPTATATLLNGGTINVTTPIKTTTIPFRLGLYDTTGDGGTLIPGTGGIFSFNNGTGGPDFGGFSVQTTLGTPITSNVTNVASVTRSSGVTVTWTGGTPNTSVTVSGESVTQVAASTTNFVGGFFWCTAPVSAGALTIPAPVTLALPATGNVTQNGVTVPLPGFLTVSNSSSPATFVATNLDFATLSGTYVVSNEVTYK